MRRRAQTPIVDLPDDVDRCCEGTITTGATDLPHHQPTVFGTPAWWAAYLRRNLTETVNSFLKGGFTTIDPPYIQMFDSTKITMAVAHTAAGLNRYFIREARHLERNLDLIGNTPPEVDHQSIVVRKPRFDRVPRWDDLDLPLDGDGPDRPG